MSLRQEEDQGMKHNFSKNMDILKNKRAAWNKGRPNTWYNPKGLELGHGRTLCIDCHKRIGWSRFKSQNVANKNE